MKKVLVIEDTPIDRMVIRTHLKVSGITNEPKLLDNAIAALEYLKSLEALPSLVPDIIFLDINMPVMSGLQFLDEYQKLPEAVKRKSIYLLSSSLYERDKQHAMSNPYVIKFIEKPITQEALRSL